MHPSTHDGCGVGRGVEWGWGTHSIALAVAEPMHGNMAKRINALISLIHIHTYPLHCRRLGGPQEITSRTLGRVSRAQLRALTMTH